MIHRDSPLLVLHHLILGVFPLRPNILTEHYASADALLQGLHPYPFCTHRPGNGLRHGPWPTPVLIPALQCVVAHSQCRLGKSLMVLPVWTNRYGGQHWQAFLTSFPVLEFAKMIKCGQVLKHFGHEANLNSSAERGLHSYDKLDVVK